MYEGSVSDKRNSPGLFSKLVTNVGSEILLVEKGGEYVTWMRIGL